MFTVIRRALFVAGLTLAVGAAAATTAPAAVPGQLVPELPGVHVKAGAQTASYSGCWGTGPTVTDWAGKRYSTRYCHNYRAGYTYWDSLQRHNGYLYAGNNWFVCQAGGGAENPPVGNARNNYWLYTQGDVGYSQKGWGWFPATYVSGGANYQPIPGLRICPAGTGG